MRVYICNICGEAHLGKEKPQDCPFCGATGNFLKLGNEADPITTHKQEVGELSRKNLMETLELERKATAIYNCMSVRSDRFEIKTMYKRLAKVENEHANIVTNLLGMEAPAIGEESCSDEEVENFKKTIELEDTATKLYARFAREATERDVKIFFTALTQVEAGHIELIKNYL